MMRGQRDSLMNEDHQEDHDGREGERIDVREVTV